MQIHKLYLHELLKQDQEPFHLKNYIADRRNSQLNKSPHHHPQQPKLKYPATTRTGTVYLRIPSTTSNLLLEAATRIIKKQGNSKPGLFSSVVKKLKRRVKAESPDEETTTFSCSCNFSGRRYSSGGRGGLSESNEMRRTCLDIDQTSTSSSSSWRSVNSIEFLVQEDENHGFQKQFWSSPSRFSPQRSPSSGQCSVVLSSPPAISPCRRKEQDMNVEANSSSNNVIMNEGKQQSSPVSVLEPQLEIEHEDEDEDEDEHKKQDYDAQCSFAFVDGAKEQLLHKLRRFEKLANLDPVELEKRMVEQLNDKDQNGSLDDEEFEDCEYMHVERGKLGFEEEEKSKPKWFERGDIMLASVCNKMDCFGEEISMTIDMMVQRDFKNELDIVWKICQEQREESGMQIELAIFGFLVEEIVEDLMEYATHNCD